MSPEDALSELREEMSAVAIRLRRYADNYRRMAKRLGASDDPRHLARADAYADAAAMIQRELDKHWPPGGAT